MSWVGSSLTRVKMSSISQPRVWGQAIGRLGPNSLAASSRGGKRCFQNILRPTPLQN